MTMEWSIMPPLPSWLGSLPSPPSLETLKPLPATVDYSQLKPLPPLNGIPFEPLRSDSLIMGAQRDETTFTSWPEEATKPSMRPLEELLMNLRRYNLILPNPEGSESSPVGYEAASDEEENLREENSNTRRVIACHDGDTRPENPDPSLSHEKKKRIRRRHYDKRYARISGTIKQYVTESKPGRIAYEARFAMRNGMWKRRIPNPLIELPNASSSAQEAMSSNGHIAPALRRALFDYSSPPGSCRSSTVSRDSSPMSICSTLERPSSPSPPIPSSLIFRPVLCDRTSPKLPPLTANSSPPLAHRTKISTFVDSHPAQQIQGGTAREWIQPTLDTTFRGRCSGYSSPSSTPRARPSELEPEFCSLNTPGFPLAAQRPTISILQLDLHSRPLYSGIYLERDGSPIPGLTIETQPEAHAEDKVQSTIPHDALLFNTLLHASIEENLSIRSSSPDLDGPSEEPPPTPLDKSEMAVSRNHSLNSLFDGELSDEETAQNSSSDSSSRSESPPSPISIRLVIPPRPNHLRNTNQQLLTPSLSPVPLSSDALWFCGPRPFASIQTSPSVLARIEEQEEVARLRPQTVVTGIISRIRREMRVTRGGSLGGQTQLILSNPLGSRARRGVLAGIDKNALQRNTECVLRAVNEHRAKE